MSSKKKLAASDLDALSAAFGDDSATFAAAATPAAPATALVEEEAEAATPAQVEQAPDQAEEAPDQTPAAPVQGAAPAEDQAAPVEEEAAPAPAQTEAAQGKKRGRPRLGDQARGVSLYLSKEHLKWLNTEASKRFAANGYERRVSLSEVVSALLDEAMQKKG